MIRPVYWRVLPDWRDYSSPIWATQTPLGSTTASRSKTSGHPSTDHGYYDESLDEAQARKHALKLPPYEACPLQCPV
ncbi:hypothetical protein SKAU_G00294990 [Synaphobranchus kaupii]|uniref:Uncharacterized protein n=1 Tax=Synaphobranchus kaupii TaxID=118154 RepID=A0A9Q1EUH6_SYNKA|nr:hypothetical protein SKAU_G00294990 [Synaphobranchus kaupii]